MIRIGPREISKTDAIESSLDFLKKVHSDEGYFSGWREFHLTYDDLQRLTKVILVGVGELSK